MVEPVPLTSLPLEVFYEVLSHLPLSSVYQLGATSRSLHRAIHQNENFWKFRLRVERNVIQAEVDVEVGHSDFNPEGLVRDPTLQGSKELYLLGSSEFRSALQSLKRKEGDDWGRYLKSFLPKSWSTTKSFFDPDLAARCALFGPGIESTNTKHLVHRMVNSHTSLFNAMDFVPGLPGGFGSGVRIDFRQMYILDLMCLYTNSESIRESRRGVTRLMAAHNKLLASDVTPEKKEQEEFLHPSVLSLLPTLHALFYALDASVFVPEMPEIEREKELAYLKSELGLMMEGLRDCERHLPILVLSCHLGRETEAIKLEDLASKLGLKDERWASRPWGVFSVNISTMDGMGQALDWVLYHVHKRRNNLAYHTKNASETL